MYTKSQLEDYKLKKQHADSLKFDDLCISFKKSRDISFASDFKD